MKENSIKLGKIISKSRKRKGISQRQLGYLVGVSSQEISRIERGIRLVPNLLTMISLCEILELGFIELLKEAGYLECKKNKVYEVVIEKKLKKVVKISSKSRKNALTSAREFMKNSNMLNPIVKTSFHISKIDDDDREFRNQMKKYLMKESKKYANYDITDDIFSTDFSDYNDFFSDSY